MSRSRNWTFTLNNYTDDEYASLSVINKQIRYIIFGKEIGDENHTPHLQGFVIFHNQKTFDQTKKFFGDRYHIEKTIGSVKQNIAYCSKDNEYIELGDAPNQGARKDIQDIKEMVAEGRPIKDIILSANSYQSAKHAQLLLSYQPAPQCLKRLVKWWWGPTGTGKTYRATQEYDDFYITMKNLKWWDGYYGQKAVIIDDFRKDFCTFHELLRILDRYPYRIEYKGGSTYIQPSTEVIIITCPYPPDQVYSTREDIGQLIRRIDEIKMFSKYIENEKDGT